MDIKIAELFQKKVDKTQKIRDAQLAMPTSRIPDLDWKFDEDIQLVEPVQKQVYSLEQTQEKEQSISPSPAAAPMEKENTTSTTSQRSNHRNDSIRSSTKPKKIEECQKTPQTPIVSRFLSVLKPVAAAVTRQITNKNSFLIVDSSSHSHHKTYSLIRHHKLINVN